MNDTLQLLKEPLQQALRDFAYLDLEVNPGGGEFRSDWALGSAVECAGSCNGTVAVFMNLDLAIRMADGMLGTESNFRQQLDVMGELANVLAGSAFEIFSEGLRPSSISTPKLLSPQLASVIWEGSPVECRYLLQSDSQIEGGLLVAFPRELRSKWN
jgi:hypothetical protein